MVLPTEEFLSGIWTSDHWTPLRHSERVGYQAVSSTRTQNQLCTFSPIELFVQCHISFRLFPSSVATFIYFNRSFLEVITSVCQNELIHMVFTTEGFFKVAIENWPEWDLNPRPLNSTQTLWANGLSGHEFNSHSKPTFCSYSNFIVFSVSHVISATAFVSHQVYLI